ncbi:MAG: proline iminopeptidase-family hydrolase [Gemmatimonadaceae bacterium]|jgi:proline iminopeptidase|nr:proline iminopeptidase-family hydrolase [Gemmatimonadaceae bacterium]
MRRLPGSVALTAMLLACGGETETRDATVASDSATVALTGYAATEGFVNVPGGKVFYRIIGDGPGTPILALHGGPGGTSCRFEVLAPLASERRIVFYDQLGSGRSVAPDDSTLWRLPRFVDEVDAVRRALGLDTIHLLGTSWGGALAAEYVLSTKPSGVRSLILSSPLISTPDWIADADSLRGTLPADVQAALDRHEAAGTLDHAEYKAATDSFYARYVRRLPVADQPECAGVTSNSAIYEYMWGPTEFTSTGSLRSWSRAEDLGRLNVPTLFIAGEYDEARPARLAQYRDRVPGAQLVVISGAAHGVLREKTAQYIEALRVFLGDVESRKRDDRQ